MPARSVMVARSPNSERKMGDDLPDVNVAAEFYARYDIREVLGKCVNSVLFGLSTSTAILSSFLDTNIAHYLLVVGRQLARDVQAKLSLIVAQCLSTPSICMSVRDSLSHPYVRSIARREPPQLPACKTTFSAKVTCGLSS